LREPVFPKWLRDNAPKDRRFLALAYNAGSGGSGFVRVVAEWNRIVHEWRRVKVPGEAIAGTKLEILGWTELPDAEQKKILNMTIRKISLRIVDAPATGLVLDAPPVLKANDHSVDYTCGKCDTILLHAEENQVHGILIRCANCGSYNSTDA
jgi:DNA-directed RNA polymerase subunit RPC12/RpoP